MEKKLEQLSINTKYTAKETMEYINELYPITLKLKRKPKKEVHANNIPLRRGENWTLGSFHDKNNIPKQYRMIVYDFIRTLESETQNRDDLRFLYKNYDTVTIHDITFQLYDLLSIIKKITGSTKIPDDIMNQAGMVAYSGKYISDENTILLDKRDEFIYTTLIHELMHMASYSAEEDKYGFCLKTKNQIIWHSLDEGINNYLCYKMFGNKGFIQDLSYGSVMSALLGEAVGFQETKSAFLRGEPVTFVGELAKYYPTTGRDLPPENSVVNLIKKMDIISCSKYNVNTPMEVNSSFYEATKIFLAKQLSQHKTMNNIPYENIHNFLSIMPNSIVVGGVEFMVDKKGIYDSACRDLNYYYPGVGYKMIA